MSKTRATTLLALALLAGTLLAESGPLVADADRGLSTCWDNLTFAGRDFWIMIEEPLHREEFRGKRYGVNSEAFVRDAGVTHIRLTSRAATERTVVMREHSMLKTLAVRLIEIFGEDRQTDLARQAVMRVASGDEARIYEVKALNDGATNTAMVVRGKVGDLETRFRPLAATIDIELPNTKALHEIRIHHGARLDARIKTPDLLIRSTGQWRPVACRVDANEHTNVFTLSPSKPVKARQVRLALQTRPYRIGFYPERLPLQAHLRTHPFQLAFIRVNAGDFLGLTGENFDAESFEPFLDEYRETFAGFAMAEWDSNVKGLKRDAMLAYLPAYTSREEALPAWKHFFDYQKTTLFGTVYALSGNLAFTQYAAAWGAKTISIETAGNLASLPVRSVLMATRGGARQFDVPWEYYCAYYLGTANPEPHAPGWGKSVSQARREYFTAYYMGATFVQGEGQCVSLVAPDKRTGRYGLSDHGRTLKELYAWSRNEKGARGQSYTPILFLVDYHHGRMGRRWTSLGWRIWNELPMEDGDYMTDQVIRATDLPIAESRPDVFRPPYSVNTRNSQLGDVFDLFFANPPQHGGVIKKEHLDRYPVAMLLGDIAMTPELVERLRTYVREGGTLVMNVAQATRGLADPQFLGVVLGDRAVAQRVAFGARTYPMDIRPVTLRGADTVMRSDTRRLPLLTRHRFGAGHVLLTTPEYLLLKSPKQMSPLIENLLLALQHEVLPFKVEGPACQFLVNRVDSHHWKVVLINNAGVIKHPFAEREYQVEQYTAAMSIVAPAGTTAEELLAREEVTTTPRHGDLEQTVFSLDVPPGAIRVLDLRVAERGSPK